MLKWFHQRFGQLAQLVERLLDVERVSGSSPLLSTRKNLIQTGWGFFLSKSQTWYIIRLWSVSHHRRCISSRFSVHSSATWWYTTRCVGDIQNSVLMIYTPRAWLVITVRILRKLLHQQKRHPKGLLFLFLVGGLSRMRSLTARSVEPEAT